MYMMSRHSTRGGGQFDVSQYLTFISSLEWDQSLYPNFIRSWPDLPSGSAIVIGYHRGSIYIDVFKNV